jgi:hypothetical protein
MADSMIERVARELCAQWSNLDPDEPVASEGQFQIAGHPDKVKTDPVQAWMLFVEKAKTLISVMREPTDEMVNDGASSVREIGRETRAAVTDAWVAMIDSALAEDVL